MKYTVFITPPETTRARGASVRHLIEHGLSAPGRTIFLFCGREVSPLLDWKAPCLPNPVAQFGIPEFLDLFLRDV